MVKKIINRIIIKKYGREASFFLSGLKRGIREIIKNQEHVTREEIERALPPEICKNMKKVFEKSFLNPVFNLK